MLFYFVFFAVADVKEQRSAVVVATSKILERMMFMKREELEKLGLSEEQVNQVVGMYGASVETLKNQLKATQDDLKVANTTIETNKAEFEKLKNSSNDNQELSKQLEELQKKYNSRDEEAKKEIAKLRTDSAIEVALTKSGARNSKAVRAMLDMDKLKLTDKGLEGLDEQITALKESDGYMFQVEDKPKPITPNGNPSAENKELSAEDKALFEGFDSI